MTGERRAKRRHDVAGGAPGLRLTERDIAMIRIVGEHRALCADQIGKLLELGGIAAGGVDARSGAYDAAKKIRDRLTELFHGGFLARPRAGFSFAYPGSEPLTYALGREGELLLRESGEAAPSARKTREARRGFLEHQLLINEVAIALRQASAVRPHLTLSIGDEAISDEATAHPLRFATDLTLGAETRRVGLEPDLAFTLQSNDRTHAFLVEVDRDTEPAVRRRQARGSRAPTLTGTSILRKLLAYAALKKSGAIAERFGWRNFKVLFVCEPRSGGGDRIARLKATASKHLAPQEGLFLFAPADAIAAGDILDLDWRAADGSLTRLAPDLTQRTS